ncbi:MAG: hypothetical protein KDA44_10485, partial [Planctomycetales bacterium]|nr:hypothetical protein [Planctomycetales bacterium]
MVAEPLDTGGQFGQQGEWRPPRGSPAREPVQHAPSDDRAQGKQGRFVADRAIPIANSPNMLEDSPDSRTERAMLYWLATSLLLAVHLLAMNVAAGGPIVAAWLWGRGAEGAALAKRLLWWSLASLLWGAAAGGVTMLLPNPGLRAALGRFSASAYWYAGTEYLFSAVCVGAMWAWAAQFQRRRWLAWFAALAASSNLLYHFPPWLTVIGRLAAEPGWGPPGVLDRRALLALMRTGEPLSLTVHVALASLAVPAIAMLWQISRGGDSGAAEDAPAPCTRGLAIWALVPTLLQLPVGVWVLASASAEVRRAAMGGDALTSTCFVAGMVAAFALTQRLASVALGDCDAPQLRRAAWWLLATVTLMSATLRGAR